MTELQRAERWYAVLFDRPPDARPMDGLIEWHLGDTFGVQIWVEGDRAGRSAMVLSESELDQLIARLDSAGVSHPAPQDVTASRILEMTDPDGNRIVVTGDFSDA